MMKDGRMLHDNFRGYQIGKVEPHRLQARRRTATLYQRFANTTATGSWKDVNAVGDLRAYRGCRTSQKAHYRLYKRINRNEIFYLAMVTLPHRLALCFNSLG